MRRFIFYLGVGFLVFQMAASPTPAQPLPFTASVSTQSAQCGNEGSRLDGHGLAFRIDDRVLVISSERRIYPTSDASFCHRVSVGNLTNAKAHFLAAEWGNGLALLEVDATKSQLSSLVLPKLSELSPVTPSNGAEVFRFSHPTPGKILLLHSRRHHLPLATFVMEVAHLSFAYDTVGEPVLDRQGNWIGLVTNRFLQLVPGGSARIREWKKADDANEENPFVLSAEEALTWTRRQLAGLDRKPAFAVTAADRLLGKSRVLSQELAWEFFCGDGRSLSSKGVPIGGNDGGGIGGDPGNDGVGAGGDSARDPACRFVEVTPTSDAEALACPTRKNVFPAKALRPLAAALQLKYRVQIPFFIEGKGEFLERSSFRDPSELFDLFIRRGTNAVVLSEPSAFVSPELFALAGTLRDHAVREFGVSFGLLYFQARARYFYQTATLLLSNQHALIDLSLLEDRVDGTDPETRAYWEQYSSFFSGHYGLLPHLKQWHEAIDLERKERNRRPR